MENKDKHESYSAAVIAELNGAIKADGLNTAALSRKIGLDYNTLRRYLSGEREIPVLVLYAIIDELTIDESDLFTLARARFDRR